MTRWGDYNGHLRVGLDWTISPASPSHNDTTVKVTWSFSVQSESWNWYDPQVCHESAGSWSQDQNFTNTLQNSGSETLASHTGTYSINYAGTATVDAACDITGTYNGAHPSVTKTLTLPARPVDVPSTGEAPTAGTITASSALISWGAVTDNGGANVDQYQLEVSTSTAYSPLAYNVTFSDTGASSHSATGLASHTKYYARVRAHNSAGWGDWTSGDYCPFTTLGTTPTTPGGLTNTAKTTTTATMAWSASNSNGGGSLTYTVQRATNSGFTTGLTTLSSTSSLSKADTGLSPSTAYWYRVKATNSIGDSSYTSGVSVTTRASVTTYGTDVGDLVTRVNSLADAMANQIGHLGIYLYRTHNSAVTMANLTNTTINMSTAVTGATRGPDAPTYTGSGTSDFTIHYPGTYLLEFLFHWPFTDLDAGHGLQMIYVNGTNVPSTTSQKFGIAEYIPTHSEGDGTSIAVNITRHTARLDVNDTVGWVVEHDCGASLTTGTTEPIVAYGRVTMIGF